MARREVREVLTISTDFRAFKPGAEGLLTALDGPLTSYALPLLGYMGARATYVPCSGHTKIESTVRYLGIEVDDALAIAEQVDV